MGVHFLRGEHHLNEDSSHPLNKQPGGFQGQAGPQRCLAAPSLASELG